MKIFIKTRMALLSTGLLFGFGYAQADGIVSGDVSVEVLSADGGYNLSFSKNGISIPLLDVGNPVFLEIRNEAVGAKYNSYTIVGDTLKCAATLHTTRGSVFQIHDNYITRGEGRIELQRKLEITAAASGDSYFNSFFGFQADTQSDRLGKNEYFVPAVWYKGNFSVAGNIPSHIPQVDDVWFLYREDRIPLPVAMFREPNSGLTVSITHKDSPDETVVADAGGIYKNADYQYGSVGFKRENNILYQMFVYPGSEKETQSGKGNRWHPVQTGIIHEYNLEVAFSTTNSYAESVKKTWNRAVDLYSPSIYPVDLQTTYNGLIETLLTYYVPSRALGGTYDVGGFPWQVSLNNFQPMEIDYAMGFVGMQVATAYYLYREGIEKNNAATKAKGEDVLNFWATKSLTSLGLPQVHYDPAANGGTGSFRAWEKTDMRQAANGMEALVAAFCFGRRNGEIHPSWLNACKKFGDWLVANQNSDGSWYLSYNQTSISGGKHPPVNTNKYLTICGIRYLTELYIATNDESYKTAALAAGEFCYQKNHLNYNYVACVIDNTQTIDSESGLMAISGFLSLWDLTKDAKWLSAAEQAATYTETWVYLHEVPVENDRTTDNPVFPKNRSIVGQHLIAVGHAAADLGFAWCSFGFYRLYLATGNPHYLRIARVAAHDTKQSMNWNGTLYAGQAKGLQLEAFSVMIPRRVGGVQTTLNWNYAAHLDPMFRFKDAFGTPDLEAVEQMSWEERQRLVAIYSQVQSANWGQETSAVETVKQEKFNIYQSNGNLIIENGKLGDRIELFNLTGQKILNSQLSTLNSIDISALSSGIYLVKTGNETVKFIKSKI